MSGPAALKRSRRDLLFALGLVVAFGAAAFAAHVVGLRWLAWVLGALAAAVLVTALFGTFEAPCPSCGRVIHHLLPAGNEYVRCGWCGRYAIEEAAALRALEEGHVAEEPVFALEIVEGLRLPRLCCACAAPAAKDEKLTMQVRELGTFTPSTIASQRTHAALAPHCEAHSGGALLRRENVAPAAGFSKEAIAAGSGMRVAPVLKVRSYRFYLEALRLIS